MSIYGLLMAALGTCVLVATLITWRVRDLPKRSKTGDGR